MAKGKTELIGAEECAKRLGLSKRYTLTLLKQKRIKGGQQIGGQGSYAVKVQAGQPPEIDPPLLQRHKGRKDVGA